MFRVISLEFEIFLHAKHLPQKLSGGTKVWDDFCKDEIVSLQVLFCWKAVFALEHCANDKERMKEIVWLDTAALNVVFPLVQVSPPQKYFTFPSTAVSSHSWVENSHFKLETNPPNHLSRSGCRRWRNESLRLFKCFIRWKNIALFLGLMSLKDSTSEESHLWQANVLTKSWWTDLCSPDTKWKWTHSGFVAMTRRFESAQSSQFNSYTWQSLQVRKTSTLSVHSNIEQLLPSQEQCSAEGTKVVPSYVLIASASQLQTIFTKNIWPSVKVNADHCSMPFKTRKLMCGSHLRTVHHVAPAVMGITCGTVQINKDNWRIEYLWIYPPHQHATYTSVVCGCRHNSLKVSLEINAGLRAGGYSATMIGFTNNTIYAVKMCIAPANEHTNHGLLFTSFCEPFDKFMKQSTRRK